MTLEERIAEIETDLLSALLEYPEVGWTDATEELIDMIRPILVEVDRNDIVAKLTPVQEWLDKAKAQETMHGKDCLSVLRGRRQDRRRVEDCAPHDRTATG